METVPNLSTQSLHFCMIMPVFSVSCTKDESAAAVYCYQVSKTHRVRVHRLIYCLYSKEPNKIRKNDVINKHLLTHNKYNKYTNIHKDLHVITQNAYYWLLVVTTGATDNFKI